MSEWGVLMVLFAAGVLLLVAEIFLPSHGILTVAGIGFFVVGTIRAYQIGKGVGTTAAVGSLLALPVFAYVSVKFWHRTPLGKRISPPNAPSPPADATAPAHALAPLIGRTGRTVSALRPVGICDFDGRRVSCICRLDMIEAGAAVEAVGISGGDLEVVESKAHPRKA
jgi:membrane-bound ClpP family serine protease